MNRVTIIIVITIGVLIVMLSVSIPSGATENHIINALPTNGCTEEWIMEDRVKPHTKETLFDHINGEAELYFPYGFEILATATYLNKDNPALAIVADVYRMGSPLDAFGIYSNYRKEDANRVAIGTEGFVSSTQLMFYQDRYFIRLQATGTTALGKTTLMTCGQAISQKLPLNAVHPRELEILKIPNIIPKTERYLAQNLLGYPFFRRGLTADVLLEGERMQIFVVLEDSEDSARNTLDQYRSYLEVSGQHPILSVSPDGIFLAADDPLYRQVLIEQSGSYLTGVIRVRKSSAAKQLMEQVRRNLRGG